MSLKPNPNKVPLASPSLTSIKLGENNKIDTIIAKLESRKKQLTQAIAHQKLYNKQYNDCRVGDGKARDGQELKQNKEWCENEKLRQRKRKYENKIENQVREHGKLEAELKATEQKIMQCVMQMEDHEIRLRKVSEVVGDAYRCALGLSEPNCYNSKKWIYHKILQLQTVLEDSDLSMGRVLCKFYKQVMAQTHGEQSAQVPLGSLVWQVVKSKLVNRLFGYILQCKLFNKSISHSQAQQVQKTDQSSSDQSESDSKKLLENEEDDHKKHHDAWLVILKHMKSLQKMHQNSTPTGTTQRECSQENTFDITQFNRGINEFIQQSLSLKKSIKGLKQKIEQYTNIRQQIEQEIKIKQELIEQLGKKVNKLSEMIVRQEADQNQSNNIEQKLKADSEKELKQIQQAIKYFHIKKSTAIQAKQQQSITHLKSLQDISTTFLSPLKSCISDDRLQSPDLSWTKKKNSQSKYSLKQLLSPPKYLNTLEKRKAWK